MFKTLEKNGCAQPGTTRCPYSSMSEIPSGLLQRLKKAESYNYPQDMSKQRSPDALKALTAVLMKSSTVTLTLNLVQQLLSSNVLFRLRSPKGSHNDRDGTVPTAVSHPASFAKESLLLTWLANVRSLLM